MPFTHSNRLLGLKSGEECAARQHFVNSDCGMTCNAVVCSEHETICMDIYGDGLLNSSPPVSNVSIVVYSDPWVRQMEVQSNKWLGCGLWMVGLIRANFHR